jgi:hypothetical protein
VKNIRVKLLEDHVFSDPVVQRESRTFWRSFANIGKRLRSLSPRRKSQRISGEVDPGTQKRMRQRLSQEMSGEMDPSKQKRASQRMSGEIWAGRENRRSLGMSGEMDPSKEKRMSQRMRGEVEDKQKSRG